MDKHTNRPLQRYQWKGINHLGQIHNGIIDATSIAFAKIELRKKGFIIRKIIKKRAPLLQIQHKKITQTDITLFTRQMATLCEAGIPLIQSFAMLANGQTNQRVKKLLETIKAQVESSLTFAESLRQHPEFFNDLFCNLVGAGEASGTLDIMLSRIAHYKEKTEHLKKKVKKALTYPIAVILFAFLVTVGLLIYVIPQFEALFQNFGADLPIFTRGVLLVSNWFQAYWFIFFTVFAGAIYGFMYAKKHAANFTISIDNLLLQLPKIGTLLQQIATARFSRTLAITFAAGLPLVDALNAVAGATGNRIFAKATETIRAEISTGMQLHFAMENTRLFPSMAINMVAIGEESGTLERMLNKIADFYENEVYHAVDALCGLLEPVIMAVLGIIIGGLIVAMYLPIVKLGSVI